MESGKDPRPDQSNDGPKYPDTGKSEPHKAPGGVGTGTKNDPAEKPADRR